MFLSRPHYKAVPLISGTWLCHHTKSRWLLASPVVWNYRCQVQLAQVLSINEYAVMDLFFFCQTLQETNFQYSGHIRSLYNVELMAHLWVNVIWKMIYIHCIIVWGSVHSSSIFNSNKEIITQQFGSFLSTDIPTWCFVNSFPRRLHKNNMGSASYEIWHCAVYCFVSCPL